MASDGNPVKIPVASLVQGSQAQISGSLKASGRFLPRGGNPATQPSAHSPAAAAHGPLPAAHVASLDAQVAQLNKHLNDSGRPDQFRVDRSSDNKVIQQINPATGEVVGEFPSAEFPALAKSLGLSGGVYIDSRA